jgi:hypothetical protein
MAQIQKGLRFQLLEDDPGTVGFRAKNYMDHWRGCFELVIAGMT